MVPEGWSRHIIGDLCDFISGNGFKASEWSPTGLPIIRIQNLNGSQDFNFFSGKPDDKWLVELGDLLFAWAGVKGVSFGPTIWKGTKGVLNQHIYRLSVREDIDKIWFLEMLQRFTARIEAQAHGFKTTLLHVHKRDITEQSIEVPPFEEQKKIARILSTWDKAIETVEKLIENSKAQKKALMQQLLMGKRRFPRFTKTDRYFGTKYGSIPSDWNFPKLGDVAEEVHDRNGGKSDIPVLACSKHEGFVDSLKYFKKKVFSNDTSNYKIVVLGTFGFPSNHIEEGSIGYQNLYEFGLVSPIYTVFKTAPEVHDGYLYKLLKTEHYRQIFAAGTNASVDRRGSLRWREFSRIRIPLPPLEEQEAISDAIDQTEKELTNYLSQLANLVEQKKALMQQLLTGKRRVKVDEA